MAKIFTVAFCGAGGIVRGNHLPAMEARPEQYKVAGFFDVVAEQAAKMAGSRYKVYGTYAELLADQAVDLVIVATKPLTTHFPATRDALAAGKHVVLEKPMAATAAECDELISLAKKQNRVLTIHHNRRLDLDFLATMDVLKKGKAGEPRLIVDQVTSGGYAGGDMVDWGVHLVDQALLLNPSPLKEVSAMFCKPEGGPADAGFLDATLRFEKLPLVRVEMMPRATEFLINGTPARVRFAVTGTGGAFIQRTIEDPRDMMNATQNFDKFRPEYAVPSYLKISRKEYYDYLYESLANGAPLLVRPEEARNAIRVIELMAASAKANATVPATGLVPTVNRHPEMTW